MNREGEKKEKGSIVTVYFQSPIGLIEIKGNSKQVLSIMFVEMADTKSSSVIPVVVRQCEKELKEYFEGKRKVFSLNLKQEGTVFQKKIWKFISEIPFGKTVTYLDLAKKNWDRNSIRAVGAAVGRNKLSIVVPCHRVVGSNGKLVGYSGGLWRKEWLLRHEEKVSFGTKELFE